MKRTETVEMSQAEIEEAIKDWLTKKDLESPGIKLNTNEWKLSLKRTVTTSGQGWGEVDHERFSCVAIRDKV
jgi:hypothetical protein